MNKKSKLWPTLIFGVMLNIGLSSCSSETDSYSAPDSADSEYSESDISACEDYLNSTSVLDQPLFADRYETAVTLVRWAYAAREDFWETVMGSSNYEISGLIYADEYYISSAAQELEDAYDEGLDVVSYTTDPSDIEDALIDFFDAFDTLNMACQDATS